MKGPKWTMLNDHSNWMYNKHDMVTITKTKKKDVTTRNNDRDWSIKSQEFQSIDSNLKEIIKTTRRKEIKSAEWAKLPPIKQFNRCFKRVT